MGSVLYMWASMKFLLRFTSNCYLSHFKPQFSCSSAFAPMVCKAIAAFADHIAMETIIVDKYFILFVRSQ